jgi:type VI secretion system protein ImpM
MTRQAHAEVVFFGKLPSRGDFVRNRDGDPGTERLDRWLTLGVERLAQDPRWKEIYDSAPQASFAFLGPRSRQVLAGHLTAGVDSSGRRFPFVMVGRFEVEAPQAFLPRAPLALAPLWTQLAGFRDAAFAAADAVPVLNQAGAARPEVEVDAVAHEPGWQDFLSGTTLGQLQDQMQMADAAVDLRLAMLGLGFLLQPVPASGVHELERGVRLPMPSDPRYRLPCAALWLDLIGRFLGRGEFEVALFLPTHARWMAPCAAISFSGNSPAMLHALLDPQQINEHFIDLRAPEWADGMLAEQPHAARLGAYLSQSDMSLGRARQTFFETFLGAST